MTVIILISVLLIIALSVALKILITLRGLLGTLEESRTSPLKDRKKKADDGTTTSQDETVRTLKVLEMTRNNEEWLRNLTKFTTF